MNKMTASTNINNHFFEGTYKEAWKGLIPSGLTEAEVDFIIDVAALGKDDKVLDLMCGYGRHSLELARKGIQVTAVDNLKAYIDEINLQATTDGLPVQAFHADILNFEPAEQYKAAICMGNSFAFFAEQDAVSILRNISAHLNSDGILIINSWMIAEIAIRHFKEKDWHYAGEYKCLLDYRYCFHPSRIESEQTIISSEGFIETVKGVDYIFTLDELERMFNNAGLRTRALYSTPRKRKFSLGDGHIYIVAEKISVK